MARKISRRGKKTSISRSNGGGNGIANRRTVTTDNETSNNAHLNDENLRQSSNNLTVSSISIHRDETLCLCFLRKGLFLPPDEMMITKTSMEGRRPITMDDSDLKGCGGTKINTGSQHDVGSRVDSKCGVYRDLGKLKGGASKDGDDHRQEEIDEKIATEYLFD